MDVVLDTVGGETFQRAFQTLKKRGFMVTVVAFPGGEAEHSSAAMDRHLFRLVESRHNKALLTAYFGAIRREPSKRMTSPFK